MPLCISLTREMAQDVVFNVLRLKQKTSSAANRGEERTVIVSQSISLPGSWRVVLFICTKHFFKYFIYMLAYLILTACVRTSFGCYPNL
jgi:hypothetical protein